MKRRHQEKGVSQEGALEEAKTLSHDMIKVQRERKEAETPFTKAAEIGSASQAQINVAKLKKVHISHAHSIHHARAPSSLQPTRPSKHNADVRARVLCVCVYACEKVHKDECAWLSAALRRHTSSDAKLAASLNCPERFTSESRAMAIAFYDKVGRASRIEKLLDDTLATHVLNTGSVHGDALGGAAKLQFASNSENQASLDRTCSLQ